MNGGDSWIVVMKRLLKFSEGSLYIDVEVATRIEKRISAWTFFLKKTVILWRFCNISLKVPNRNITILVINPH